MAGNRPIDRISDPSYLHGLSEKPLPEVRVLRAEVDEEEATLSYERRLLQARMDILKAERERRAGGGASLLERLPQILADDSSPSRGAMPLSEPPTLDNPRRRVELLVSDDTLANLSELPDEEIDKILATLAETEKEVSGQRSSVLSVLDSLTEEIGRRYASGEVDPRDILQS